MKDDLISRQAAIDALAKFVPYAICDESTESYTNGLTDAYNLILQLPSAQPEPVKINIDDFNKEDLERFKKELGNTPITVLPAQPEIIRCKDCKFASGDSRICMKFGHSPIGELDFCAWAERRTDG